jgi:hypothetical protein
MLLRASKLAHSARVPAEARPLNTVLRSPEGNIGCAALVIEQLAKPACCTGRTNIGLKLHLKLVGDSRLASLFEAFFTLQGRSLLVLCIKVTPLRRTIDTGNGSSAGTLARGVLFNRDDGMHFGKH